MASEASKLQVGIFVIAAAAIALGAAIWLGATSFLEDSETFVTYFSESVQGVDPGSAVKYRGVPAGRVAHIGIAPDEELIEVRLEIDTHLAPLIRGEKNLRAKLELAGITGLRYVEIEPTKGEALAQAPVLDFDPDYELIPSAKSSFTAIQQALGDIYDLTMQLDVGGISDDIRNTLHAASELMTDPRIGQVLDNLNETSASTARLSAHLEEITSDVDFEPVLANAEDAALEARRLFATLNAVSTDEIAGAASNLASLAQTGQHIISGIQYTIERMDRTVGSLRDFTEEIRSQPSLLFFADPPVSEREVEEKE